MKITVQPLSTLPTNKELFSGPELPKEIKLEPVPPLKAEKETEVLKLENSKYVHLTAKEVKNIELPEYLQLELDLNPLKEGETMNADNDSSIRHTGKP